MRFQACMLLLVACISETKEEIAELNIGLKDVQTLSLIHI